MSSVLVVDFRDSFVHTIVSYLRALGAKVEVRRSDRTDADEAERLRPAGLLLSPGPGRPDEARLGHELLDRFAGAVPVLGVCLGHQVIAEHWGAIVSRAAELRHGETSPIRHDGAGVFAGLANPFTATRYHSLAVEPASVRDPLTVSATSEDGTVMGLRHRTVDVEGVQFHPESILTEDGSALLGNWLRRVEDAKGA
ncbi:anthranilate synthase component II [Glycomyces harbinensis]|uniref:Anthranilate synthase component 2/para-aminobenzoate synthetase component 2 n=1 Tax=Glycomyces harbinensis TaxID=58114 RepID=A0A1G7DBS4_9ACTN|nr:aminodeoxychorismate/anthranilate synthase component II [Glycomyces harbinensis]SDE48195.1 anthranilate synthase component 2/para-aminobenzoate synthetase component 2 [Glycomyces harbinensis]